MNKIIINKDKAGVNRLGSCYATDKLVDYLNTLNIPIKHNKIIEEIISDINSECESMQQEMSGESW